MTTRQIHGHLKEIYKVEVSQSLISAVTAAVLEDVKAWQARPLDAVYPIVYLDAIHVKIGWRSGCLRRRSRRSLSPGLTLAPASDGRLLWRLLGCSRDNAAGLSIDSCRRLPEGRTRPARGAERWGRYRLPVLGPS